MSRPFPVLKNKQNSHRFDIQSCNILHGIKFLVDILIGLTYVIKGLKLLSKTILDVSANYYLFEIQLRPLSPVNNEGFSYSFTFQHDLNIKLLDPVN